MAAATGTVRAEDRPEIIKPWIAPEGTRARVLRGLEDRPAPRQFEDRSDLLEQGAGRFEMHLAFRILRPAMAPDREVK